MQNTKKKRKQVEPPMDDELLFQFREFLMTTDIASCMDTLTDLLLHRDDQYALPCNDQIDLRNIFYFFREIHKKTYKPVAGLM
jgi:hypothetical protein